MSSNHWPSVPLGEVVNHRKEFVTIDDLARYARCRVQLHARGIIQRDVIHGSEIRTKKQQVVRAGELLVAEIDAKVGGYGIIPADLHGAIVSSHYFLFGIDDNRLDRRFLGYYLRTPGFRDQVTARGSTNYAAIRPKHVLGYQIPLPPLDEQRRIVARIDGLAGKVEEAQALKAATAPVCARYWKVLSQIARSAGGTEVNLGDVAQFLDAQRVPLSKAARADRAGPYPYYGASGIIDHIDAFVFEEPLLLLAEDGANLLNRSTPIAFIARGKYWVNNHAHVLRPDPQVVDMEYLAHALADYNVDHLNYASAQPKLNQRNAKAIRLAIPPLEGQIRVVRRLSALRSTFEQVSLLQRDTSMQVEAALPSLLHQAFAGGL